jgi:hypothetical protein
MNSTNQSENGQAVQIMLEELKDLYGTQWTTTLVDIQTNDQKKDWFLKLDPNGTQTTTFTIRCCYIDNMLQAVFPC